jgi:hypothetical protein
MGLMSVDAIGCAVDAIDLSRGGAVCYNRNHLAFVRSRKGLWVLMRAGALRRHFVIVDEERWETEKAAEGGVSHKLLDHEEIDFPKVFSIVHYDAITFTSHLQVHRFILQPLIRDLLVLSCTWFENSTNHEKYTSPRAIS